MKIGVRKFMSFLKGIAASSGIAIAKAYLLNDQELIIEKKEIEVASKELDRLHEALRKSRTELEAIRDKIRLEMGTDYADIFEAHLLILSDPELIHPIVEKIQSEKVNAEYALKEAAGEIVSLFEQMNDDYMKERATDIRDVTKRVLSHLLGVGAVFPNLIMEDSIVVANDLTPSHTAQLNRQFVKGFTTNIGGRTSHSAIMARSLEIPAVVGTKTATKEIKHGDLIILDGLKGEVHVNPTVEVIEYYEKKQELYKEQKAEWAKLIDEKTKTSDGHVIELAANIGTPEDLEGVINNGGEAIGLYRTEFIYMGRKDLPSEEEQFQSYKSVLEGMKGKPVVVRTLDIGGDKELPYLNLSEESNPFLGLRGIRLCLKEQHLFRTQLRALLRSSSFGNLKIMFPMVSTLDEFREAKAILNEEKEKLLSEGIAVSDHIEIGIMVEIPSTAILSDQFAKEVDFFSIGSNDLIQYTMAADRMNEKVSYLYQPYNPAILRLVKMVIDAAHKEGKRVGMCGEMAGDEMAIPLLLGLGLDELSMSPSSILRVRSQIRQLSKEKMVSLANQALGDEGTGRDK